MNHLRFLLSIFLYRFFISLFSIGALLYSTVNTKAKRLILGRKKLWQEIKTLRFNYKKIIWFHCASLGEFEQGLPFFKILKEKHPEYSFILSFFSSSGYEKQKNNPDFDFVFYLPSDTQKNMQKLIRFINPQLVIIVKYEFWYFLLKILHQKKIPVILISGIFLPQQIFFRWYGSLHRQMLSFFKFIFVQENVSKKLLNTKLKIQNVIVAGDTRFDRVVENTKNIKKSDYEWVKQFKQDKKLFVVGSSWKTDDKIFMQLQKKFKNIKLIIAPHEIDNALYLSSKFDNSICYSQIYNVNIENYSVLILDTIGLLSKLYSFADYVYVGGGFTKSGIHNILEPAVFGKLIFIGPQFSKYKEALDLEKLKALFVVHNKKELWNYFIQLDKNLALQEQTKKIVKNYIYINEGASEKIYTIIEKGKLL